MLCCATDAVSSRIKTEDREEAAQESAQGKLLQKFVAFSKKYQFAESIGCSLVKSTASEVQVLGSLGDDETLGGQFRGVTINSIFCTSTDNSVTTASVASEASFSVADNSLIEHSLLSGSFRIGKRTIVSNITGAMGHGLVVLDGIMVQQVPLRPHVNALFDHVNSPRAGGVQSMSEHVRAPFVLLTFSINDNIKAHYKDAGATICGAPFKRLLEVS
jgi:hypothetical protein